ncbi:hypothetical protein HanIR_Chr09g0412301 [Helianthus annuus]|nr:hypothetical protein HanIR_Chr09g0412301 [Helianthus annuus]
MLSFHLRQILCFELRCLVETAIELGRILDHGLRYQSICSSFIFTYSPLLAGAQTTANILQLSATTISIAS